MTEPNILGAWRLISLTRRGRPLRTGQTHLIVREDVLWELWPKSVYYEGDPGPEREYRLDWRGTEGFLEEHHPGHANQCAIIRLEGTQLSLRQGAMAGEFPESFDDEEGSLAVYERETSPGKLETLLQPRPRLKRPTRAHPLLGDLAFDARLSWWQGKVELGGVAAVPFHVEAAVDVAEEVLDRAAAALAAVRCEELKAFAAAQLLDLKNDNWLGDDEDEVDAATFAARLTPESFGVQRDGSVSVFFDDGDLFWGHVVIVSLDEQLKPVDAEMAG